MNYPHIFTPQKHLIIYINKCADEEYVKGITATLTAEECSLFNKITSPLRRAEFLSLRKFLSDELGKTVHVHYNAHGKPYIQNEPYELSVSHSSGLIAFALSNKRPVGIDIQHPKPQVLRISKKFLNEQELQQAAGDLLKTTILWCAKEAVYKWYSKRKLIFSRDMQMEFGSDQTLNVLLKTPGKNRHLTARYELISGIPLVYVI